VFLAAFWCLLYAVSGAGAAAAENLFHKDGGTKALGVGGEVSHQRRH